MTDNVETDRPAPVWTSLKVTWRGTMKNRIQFGCPDGAVLTLELSDHCYGLLLATMADYRGFSCLSTADQSSKLSGIPQSPGLSDPGQSQVPLAKFSSAKPGEAK